MKRQYLEINNKRVPLISGGKGGCFAAGTLISTPDGDKNIEDLRVRDKVYCFDSENNLRISTISQVFIHENMEVIDLKYWGGNLTVTPNHWFLCENNHFLPIKEFDIDWALYDFYNGIRPITEIVSLPKRITTYNFTVDKFHTYFANGIKVHNKGGSKSGATAAPGVESPNTLFSTDILFLTVSLGEGPIYRINSNGPQDIEINESTIDDLINLDSDGNINSDVFHTDTRTGTLTQTVMPIFGEEAVTPQNFASPVILRKGNLAGVPKASVTLQDTSVNSWDSLRFTFNINALQRMNTRGDIFTHSISVRVDVYDNIGSEIIASVSKTINGKTNTPFRFNIDIPIPENKKSDSGYKFSIEKTSDDSDSSKIQDNIAVTGWDEIENDDFAYPRTALIGYAIKAAGEHTGGVPTFTSMVKGLLCKVPNNYNQPILENGEIDWRELELPETGTNGYTVNGYRLQKSGKTQQTSINPVIYEGLWDGSFVRAWTQNPVWILYDLLTNQSYGVGIPEDNIDKFKFYKVAQYCDAIDPFTGQYIGVDGIADGTYRYKPQGKFTSVRETLIGIPSGTQIKERRFICDISIASQQQLMDLIITITGIFRGVLFYSGGKLSLNVDLPDEVPVAIFNETNIEKDSINISGIKETDILTGVEVSYIEPNNHYRREVVRIDDSNALRERNHIENVSEVELTGVTKRSQAIRFAQYLLAASKFIRRKITFTTSLEAINLTIGDVVSVSQRAPGTSWGFGGRLMSNSTVGESNVVLEHFTSPAMTSSTFTANTLPMVMRLVRQEDDRVDLYILSNTDFSVISSGNTATGADVIEAKILRRFNHQTKIFTAENTFQANNVPKKYDIWTIGEMNPAQFYSGENDKLFKITNLNRTEDGKIIIQGAEYVSNVYTDSDTLISYVPVKYKDTTSPLVPPPAPVLSLRAKLVRMSDGSVRNDLEIFVSTDRSGYPINIETITEHSAADVSENILEIS